MATPRPPADLPGGSKRFTKDLHIRKNDDFQKTYQRRCSASDERLLIYARLNELPHSRLGLSVSKKVGGAVIRNRIRRKLREAFRLIRADLPAGIDLVVIPRSAADFTLSDVQASLRTLALRLDRRLQSKESSR